MGHVAQVHFHKNVKGWDFKHASPVSGLLSLDPSPVVHPFRYALWAASLICCITLQPKAKLPFVPFYACRLPACPITVILAHSARHIQGRSTPPPLGRVVDYPHYTSAACKFLLLSFGVSFFPSSCKEMLGILGAIVLKAMPDIILSRKNTVKVQHENEAFIGEMGKLFLSFFPPKNVESLQGCTKTLSSDPTSGGNGCGGERGKGEFFTPPPPSHGLFHHAMETRSTGHF